MHLCHKRSLNGPQAQQLIEDLSDKTALTQTARVKVCRCRCFPKLQIEPSFFACCITRSHVCISCQTWTPRAGKEGEVSRQPPWIPARTRLRRPDGDRSLQPLRVHCQKFLLEPLEPFFSWRPCSELRQDGWLRMRTAWKGLSAGKTVQRSFNRHLQVGEVPILTFNYYFMCHDVGLEKTSASRQKGVKVPVCCLLPGTDAGV